MELALDKEPSENIAALMMAKAQLPQGQTLHDCLSDRTWLRYQSFAKDHPDQAAYFARLRPWFVAVFLSLEQSTIDGYDPDKGMDVHFFKQRGDRKVFGIETAEQQIEALAELPATTQDLMLAEQLDAMDRPDDELKSLINYWNKSDADGLAREMFKDYEDPQYAPVYASLIAQRNIRMTQQIEQWLHGTERFFVVLGAGHFIGKDGIIAKLERDGWAAHRL